MPRWASRIDLYVTGVRVERLQDISEADAIAEGLAEQRGGGWGLPDGSHYHGTDPRISYWSLWEAINGRDSVDANPWVWAVEVQAPRKKREHDMIGRQQTGAVEGVIITAVSHEGLRVSVNGQRARLAVVLDDGTVVTAGDAVAREAEAVAVKLYRNMLQGQAFPRVISKPLAT